jgi:ABC-2 type transport system ATP-binding protein
MPTPVALSLVNVRVRYGDRFAVDGVSLHVRRGEIVGLLGPNGSGKSTTLCAAAGVLDVCEGSVAVEGVFHADDPHAFAMRVGFVPQECALYEELTAAENLSFFGKLYGLTGADLRRRVVRVLGRVQLGDRSDQRIATFSGGMRQRLNLAVALIHDPTVLLLDEPTAALDPASRDALFADLGRLRDDGHAVLLSTHHLDEAELGCDRIAVLDRGQLVACGRPTDLLRCATVGRQVLYGHVRSRPAGFVLKALKQRLGPGVELEVTGRRLRLSAPTSEELGMALAAVLAEGVDLETFRTPAGTLDRTLREAAAAAPEHSGANAP